MIIFFFLNQGATGGDGNDPNPMLTGGALNGDSAARKDGATMRNVPLLINVLCCCALE